MQSQLEYLVYIAKEFTSFLPSRDVKLCLASPCVLCFSHSSSDLLKQFFNPH